MNADTIRDMQRDAAYQDMLDRNADHSRIRKLVLGDQPGRGHITDLIKLGDNDYLVQINRGAALWTTVVNGQPSSTHHHTQDMALLHLVARRHDDNATDSYQAARFAGRALNVQGN